MKNPYFDHCIHIKSNLKNGPQEVFIYTLAVGYENHVLILPFYLNFISLSFFTISIIFRFTNVYSTAIAYFVCFLSCCAIISYFHCSYYCHYYCYYHLYQVLNFSFFCFWLNNSFFHIKTVRVSEWLCLFVFPELKLWVKIYILIVFL